MINPLLMTTSVTNWYIHPRGAECDLYTMFVITTNNLLILGTHIYRCYYSGLSGVIQAGVLLFIQAGCEVERDDDCSFRERWRKALWRAAAGSQHTRGSQRNLKVCCTEITTFNEVRSRPLNVSSVLLPHPLPRDCPILFNS